MTDVKSLLNKKKFTGEDLGRIEITNMSLSFKDALEGNPNSEPFIEISKLQTLINALDKKQLKMYNNYIEVHDWITVKYNISQTHFQQAQLQLKILWEFLSESVLAEEFFTYIAKIDADNKPPIPEMIEENSLKVFFEENAEFENSVDIVTLAREAFFTSYYLLKGYNKSLELIAEEYGIPDICIFKRDFTKLQNQIDNFNELTKSLLDKIQSGEYINTPEIKKRKLEVLKKYFYSIDVSDIKLPQSKINEVKSLLKDFKAFRMPAQDPIYSILFIQ